MCDSNNFIIYDSTSFIELSPAEMKVLNLICDVNETDVSSIYKRCSLEKKWKYTTVLTMIQNLYRKGYLTRRKQGRKYIYKPVLAWTDLFEMYLKKFFGTNFKENPSPLIEYLSQIRELSDREQNVLKTILIESNTLDRSLPS